MVKHLIFNTKILRDSEKEIIDSYTDAFLSSNNSEYTYEYYRYYKDEIKYEEMEDTIEKLLNIYPELVNNYTLITSLDDFYRAINKEIIFELW